MKITCIAIGLMMAVLQQGCATTAYMRADRSVLGAFDTGAGLYIQTNDTMSVAEGNFMVLLVEQIRKSGLIIESDKAKADYVLSFSLADAMFLGQGVRYEPVLNPVFHTDEAAISYYPVPNAYGYPGIKISLAIYTKQGFLKAPHIPVWEASLLVKRETLKDQGEALIHTMISYVGQSYDGRVTIR